ncbi:MAG: class I SAM-dependent methyltransferase [Byssovorax sp.]
MASLSPAARALFALHHRAIHLPRVERVTRSLAAQIGRAASLLDIGCGDGSVAAGIGAAVGARTIAGVDVLVRPATAIPVTPYDGEHLPFADGAFEAVVISDVLHHCEHPAIVLREALRVASRVVAIKDHFRVGRFSNAILLAMDRVGNAGPGVLVRGTYFTGGDFATLVHDAGGRITGLSWPLRIHDLPWRLITQDRLQFTAKIQHLGTSS